MLLSPSLRAHSLNGRPGTAKKDGQGPGGRLLTKPSNRQRPAGQQRRGAGCTAAAPDGAVPGHWHTNSEAAATVERCLELFQASNLDGVCEFLPDRVVDRCLDRRRAKLITTPFQDITFNDLLDLSVHGDFLMDAYARRGLLLAPPAATRMLSSLKVSEEEFLQRYAVTAASGEEMVVTFRMQLEDSLVFLRSQTHIRKAWFLRGITGEPATVELPTQPHPRWGPESVVLAQLEALRSQDLAAVFRLASPESQLLAGGQAKFESMLHNAVYRPLLGHRAATLLQSAQRCRDVAWVLVSVAQSTGAVDSSIPRRATYAWTLRLQGATRGGDPALANCWLVEGVTPFTTRLHNI